MVEKSSAMANFGGSSRGGPLKSKIREILQESMSKAFKNLSLAESLRYGDPCPPRLTVIRAISVSPTILWEDLRVSTTILAASPSVARLLLGNYLGG